MLKEGMIMPHMKSPYTLQYIDALLKHGNFTKAAKDLYISQPYLTQTIKKVEKELGTEIINRKSPQLQLTDAGKIYYQYLETIEEEGDFLKRKLATYTKTANPVIRIGILPSLATYILPLVLPTFMRNYPETPLSINEDLPKINEIKAINQELDFYIGQNPESVSPSLITRDCGHQTYYAIIPKSSELYQADRRLLAKGTIPIDKLLQQKLVLTTSGSAIRRQVDRLLQRYKISPQVALESSNIYTVAELAKKNAGVAFVPEGLLTKSKAMDYNLYPISTDLISIEYFIAYSAAKTLTPTLHDFVETFVQEIRALTLHDDLRG
jgi:DNA-binding transcriptional LysR family regulator